MNELLKRYGDVLTWQGRAESHDTSGVTVRAKFFFDVKVNGVSFDVVAVGDFGYAFKPYIIPEGLPRFVGTYELKELTDVNTYRGGMLTHNMERYLGCITIENKTLKEMFGDNVTMNLRKFLDSKLYLQAVVYRDEKGLTDVTTRQIYEFFSLMPTEPVVGCTLPIEVQQDLIRMWEEYDCTQ